MLFAELVISEAVWLAIVGILAFVVKDFMDQRREERRAEREVEREEREVARAEKLGAAVEVIHVASNKMKDELVNEVRKVGEANAIIQRAEGVEEGQTKPMPEATVKGRPIDSGEGPPQNLDAEEIREITEEPKKG